MHPRWDWISAIFLCTAPSRASLRLSALVQPQVEPNTLQPAPLRNEWRCSLTVSALWRRKGGGLSRHLVRRAGSA